MSCEWRSEWEDNKHFSLYPLDFEDALLLFYLCFFFEQRLCECA